MAATTAKKMSIYEKLMEARIQFGQTEKTKSGVNAHAEFKYYELSDIVPIATNIFFTLGLSFITTFEENGVLGILHDVESGQELSFRVPFATLAEPGKYRQNEIQAMGGAITYFRRYMYMLVLDIVEPDAFDGATAPEPKTEKDAVSPAPKAKAPKTSEERKEIKEELIPADAPADEIHIKSLKNVLKSLKKLKPDAEDEIQTIVIKTEGFKKITNIQAEELIKKYGELVRVLTAEQKENA